MAARDWNLLDKVLRASAMFPWLSFERTGFGAVQHRNNVPRRILMLTSVRAFVLWLLVLQSVPMMQLAWIFYRLFLFRYFKYVCFVHSNELLNNFKSRYIPGHLEVK